MCTPAVTQSKNADNVALRSVMLSLEIQYLQQISDDFNFE